MRAVKVLHFIFPSNVYGNDYVSEIETVDLVVV